MPDPTLVLRPVTGRRQHDDYDVFDGDREVGRIYLVDFYKGRQFWFWAVSFKVTGRRSSGHAQTLGEARAAFRAEYAAWKSGGS